MIDNIIEDILTEDEKEILTNIEKKIANKIEELKKTKYDHLNTNNPTETINPHPEVFTPVHVTDSPHEIKVMLLVEVSSIDEKGYIKDVKDVFQKDYYIPLTPEQDYMKHVDKFVKTFEQKLTSTCQETINPPKDHDQ